VNTSESFISHLIELRERLIRIVIGIVLAFLVLFPFADEIYTLLAQPLLASLPSGGQMIATEVTTPFFVPMKVAMLTAFIISLPHSLYQGLRLARAVCA
jgi:sec-independent protein translocase protein TatC